MAKLGIRKLVIMVAAAIVLIGSAIASAAMSSNQTSQQTNNDNQLFPKMINFHQEPYVNNDYDFQMIYPEGWVVSEGAKTIEVQGRPVKLEGGAYIVSFYGPTQNGYTTNINVLTDTLGDLTFADYINNSKAYLARADAKDNYELIEDRQLNIADDPTSGLLHASHEIVYTAKIEGKLLKIGQSFVENGKQVYIITYAATPKMYEENSLAYKGATDSFTFLS